MKLLVKKLNERAKIPTKAHDDDACWDIYALNNITVPPQGSKLVETGLAILPPKGYWAKIYDRSSIAYKNQLFVTAGVIDQYTGEWKLLIFNHSPAVCWVPMDSKIAQFTLHKTYTADIVVTNELPTTKRADGGFGSTDRSKL